MLRCDLDVEQVKSKIGIWRLNFLKYVPIVIRS